MIIDRISTLLADTDTVIRKLPPTLFFNQGWMLRLVLDWLSQHSDFEHELALTDSDGWYTEALLPSPFAGSRGIVSSESWAHADGVMGHFIAGANRTGDLVLQEGASRFMVVAARMFGRLSPGLSPDMFHALPPGVPPGVSPGLSPESGTSPNCGEAAQCVACMAEMARRAAIHPGSFSRLGFYVIAPQDQIDAGVFRGDLSRERIRSVVSRRAEGCEHEARTGWLQKWFMPLMDVVRLREIAWEEVLEAIGQYDSRSAAVLGSFYAKCMEFHRQMRTRYMATGHSHHYEDPSRRD